jgi:hypothetical protein
VSIFPRKRPRQLPPPLRRFVGREHEMSILTDFADQALAADTSQVVVIAGVHGAGRTSLAVQWAWTNLKRFRGGHLFSDLNHYRQRGGVDTTDVMGQFLRTLGVRDARQPDGLSARTDKFRVRTAGESMLVLLDNADQAAQVRPFIPTSGGSIVLVTSQSKLSGLAMDGAHTLLLSSLGADD